ncbi:MAG: hypothetical protein Q4D16_14500 [Eubacteriales bacterium]|nr:hypothetical protein [Eubacteriales bacterium]
MIASFIVSFIASYKELGMSENGYAAYIVFLMCRYELKTIYEGEDADYGNTE